jgi:enamine deaminase RidA (YjgF/YER057c/UK114 family)
MNRLALVLFLILAVALPTLSGKKKKKHKQQEEEPVTQVLELPKDLPQAVAADASQLVFQVTPLSRQGLLSQQLREALKWLFHLNHPVVKLRAFVAGTGDTRRVQAVVSEAFTEKHWALPALSVVQVGALPVDGAQVVLESIAMDRKPVNQYGVAFLAAQSAYINEPFRPVPPQARQVLGQMQAALKAAHVEPAAVLRLTCYPSVLDQAAKLRALFADAFPNATLNLVQPLRADLQSGISCEAAGRLASPPASPLEFAPASGAEGPHRSSAALVAPGRIVLTGAQLAFGTAEADARLTFERLGKTIEQLGAAYSGVAVTHIYCVSRSTGELALKAGDSFFEQTRGPALVVVPFEGLPSLDASFAVDAIAVPAQSK